MPKAKPKTTVPIKIPKDITRRHSANIKKILKSDKITPEIADLADQADKTHALDVMAQTEGARVLVDTLVSDVITSISNLTSNYKRLPEMELRSICAEMSANLAIILAITRAKGNRKALEDNLKEILEDALKT